MSRYVLAVDIAFYSFSSYGLKTENKMKPNKNPV